MLTKKSKIFLADDVEKLVKQYFDDIKASTSLTMANIQTDITSLFQALKWSLINNYERNALIGGRLYNYIYNSGPFVNAQSCLAVFFGPKQGSVPGTPISKIFNKENYDNVSPQSSVLMGRYMFNAKGYCLTDFVRSLSAILGIWYDPKAQASFCGFARDDGLYTDPGNQGKTFKIPQVPGTYPLPPVPKSVLYKKENPLYLARPPGLYNFSVRAMNYFEQLDKNIGDINPIAKTNVHSVSYAQNLTLCGRTDRLYYEIYGDKWTQSYTKKQIKQIKKSLKTKKRRLIPVRNSKKNRQVLLDEYNIFNFDRYAIAAVEEEPLLPRSSNVHTTTLVDTIEKSTNEYIDERRESDRREETPNTNLSSLTQNFALKTCENDDSTTVPLVEGSRALYDPNNNNGKNIISQAGVFNFSYNQFTDFGIKQALYTIGQIVFGTASYSQGTYTNNIYEDNLIPRYQFNQLCVQSKLSHLYSVLQKLLQDEDSNQIMKYTGKYLKIDESTPIISSYTLRTFQQHLNITSQIRYVARELIETNSSISKLDKRVDRLERKTRNIKFDADDAFDKITDGMNNFLDNFKKDPKKALIGIATKLAGPALGVIALSTAAVNSSSIALMQSDIGELTNNVTSISNELQPLKEQSEQNTSKINGLELKDETIVNTIDQLTQVVNSNESNISQLWTYIHDNSETLGLISQFLENHWDDYKEEITNNNQLIEQMITSKVATITSDINNLRTTVANNSSQITSNTQSINSIKSRLNSIEYRLDSIENVAYSRIDNLEANIERIDNRMQELSQKLSESIQSLNSCKSDLTNLSRTVASNSSQISQILESLSRIPTHDDFTNLSNLINTNKQNIDSMKTRLDSTYNKATSNATDIYNLTYRLDGYGNTLRDCRSLLLNLKNMDIVKSFIPSQTTDGNGFMRLELSSFPSDMYPRTNDAIVSIQGYDCRVSNYSVLFTTWADYTNDNIINVQLFWAYTTTVGRLGSGNRVKIFYLTRNPNYNYTIRDFYN